MQLLRITIDRNIASDYNWLLRRQFSRHRRVCAQHLVQQTGKLLRRIEFSNSKLFQNHQNNVILASEHTTTLLMICIDSIPNLDHKPI